MSIPSGQPQFCTASSCCAKCEPATRVEIAAALCADRGAQLTELRREVLELLWEHDRPTGAYEMVEALKIKHSRPIGPPTVYRALDFLMAQRLVSKIESRNAYVPCTHPERPHDCVFFLCSSCGKSVEIEDPRVEKLLAEDAATVGYQIKRRVVEVEGTCASCGTDGVGRRN